MKQAVDEITHGWLRAEQAAYAAIEGTFMPAVGVGDGTLVLEDLSGAHWPPPWTDADLRAARAALDEVHALSPPPGLPHPEDNEDLRGGWGTVANEPQPLDIRSDNMCVAGGRCQFVDWNWVCRGNPDLDDAFWLPSLRLEGGPEPSGHPELAALFASFLVCRAGLPEPARGVRSIQRAQLQVALPWAARELGLSPPRPR